MQPGADECIGMLNSTSDNNFRSILSDVSTSALMQDDAPECNEMGVGPVNRTVTRSEDDKALSSVPGAHNFTIPPSLSSGGTSRGNLSTAPLNDRYDEHGGHPGRIEGFRNLIPLKDWPRFNANCQPETRRSRSECDSAPYGARPSRPLFALVASSETVA